jgi:hypothetical protein
MYIFIDFEQLYSSKPTGRVHGNRTAAFMIAFISILSRRPKRLVIDEVSA